MKKAGWIIAVLSLTACGGDSDEESGRLGFGVFLSRATADLISEFQVSVLSKGSSFSCATVRQNCLNLQVKPAQLQSLTDSAGKSHPALRFPAALKVGTNTTQDVTIEGLPVGRDFLVVIEALSKDTVPKLVGSACNIQQEIKAGTNATLIATIPNAQVDCDPRFEK